EYHRVQILVGHDFVEDSKVPLLKFDEFRYIGGIRRIGQCWGELRQTMHEAKHTRRTKSVLRGGCPREVSKGFHGRIRTQSLQILLKIIGNRLDTTCIEV